MRLKALGRKRVRVGPKEFDPGHSSDPWAENLVVKGADYGNK